ncbi:LCP family protein [Lacticaseibacillus pabuli]|uniref:LCP family protein n=1 Tax=Lacticaseibacillus pabuli TaxID=3025672 RepID=A0ABY7WTV4_9LACO|nr:LCP family protein [Lacticaseibacillus sp. KACC 23028]WDF83592.1 LCP family protein [Lacticaseibacillus sp. KACC 23028]
MGPEFRRVHPRHPIANFIFVCISAVVIILGAYGLKMYGDTRNAFNSTFQQLAGRANASAKIKEGKPVSFLLMGTDTGALGRKEKGNSDTMIVVTINPKTKKSTMVSIPRDTLADIQDGSSRNLQKVNSAYFRGGSNMAVKTVENLLNIKLDYYVTVNMGGLSKIVDAVGGIDVKVPFSWDDTAHDAGVFKKGPAHLNGKRALQFARMRKLDPEGDYGRQKRQQTVIKAIMKKVLSTQTIGNYEPLLASLKGNLRMNLTFDDLVAIGSSSKYRAALENLKRDQLQGTGATIDGGSYQVTKNSELQRVSDLINTSLGEPTEQVDNAVTHENDANSNFDWKSGWNPVYTIYPQSQSSY